MARTNRPVTSREYKLMLTVDRFADRQQGTEAFWDLVEFLVEKQGATTSRKGEKTEKRLTWYLDTSEHALRKRGYILRLREEEEADQDEEFKLTLKYRASDRYISAFRDLSGPDGSESKFEEDIVPPFISRFSHSTSTKSGTVPKPQTVEDVVSLFRGLKELKIPGEWAIGVVNGFRAHEVAHRIGRLHFGDLEVNACLSFWYLRGEKKNERPLVSEFSFDYDLPDDEKPPSDRLEEFPADVVEGANRFFSTLQKQSGWVDKLSETKTDYAYDAL